MDLGLEYKNIDEKWYDYDDSSCLQLVKNIITSATYALFYRRKC